MGIKTKNLKLAAAIAVLLGLGSGCVKPFGPLGPPPPPTPTATPTATITPGCQTSGFNTLSGSGTLATGSILLVITPTLTPTPSWTWTGAVPPHPGGYTVIQTAADWSAFVASSYLPAATFPIPFNPATQAMIVIDTEGFCPNLFSVSTICNNGNQITVQLDEYQSCCPTVFILSGVLNTTAFKAVIVDNFGLPVVVNHTYFPWVGPLCV